MPHSLTGGLLPLAAKPNPRKSKPCAAVCINRGGGPATESLTLKEQARERSQTPDDPSTTILPLLWRQERRTDVRNMFHLCYEPWMDSVTKTRVGRGAASNDASGRFNALATVPDFERGEIEVGLDAQLRSVKTEVRWVNPKTIISFNQSPDIPFDRSINTVQGCEHGCIYCFARPTHAYHELSPGVDFESRLFAKRNIAQLLKEELRRPTYEVAPIALGTNTDPYQPIERNECLARGVIEILLEAKHPLMITTKSDRVVRDLDLLVEMSKLNLVGVAISITTLNGVLASKLEPRAPHPDRRLKAVEKLVSAGVPTFVNIAPVIPAITDNELEDIIARSAAAGAVDVSYMPVRLPHEVAPLFREWLQVHFPERAEKVMSIIRSIRGGRDNDPNFFGRMRGKGPWAELLNSRFKVAKLKNGFTLKRREINLRTDLFRRPAGLQGELFDA